MCLRMHCFSFPLPAMVFSSNSCCCNKLFFSSIRRKTSVLIFLPIPPFKNMKIIGLDGWNIHIVMEYSYCYWNAWRINRQSVVICIQIYNYNTMGMTYSYFDLEKSYFMWVRLVKKEEGKGGIRRMTWVCFYLALWRNQLKLDSHLPKRVVLFASLLQKWWKIIFILSFCHDFLVILVM